MKISFEGNTIREVIVRMREALTELAALQTASRGPSPAEQIETSVLVEAPKQREKIASPPPVETPADNPVEKPKKARTAKQLENDERLREKALARIAAGGGFQKKAAKAKPVDKAQLPLPLPMPVDAPQPPQQEDPFLDPAEIVKVRQKTIEDLQAAYAGGKQQEVFELLSRFGNGAKSFRELPPDAFVPISKAIALGALT